jgi:hypothetical protein
MPNFGAIYIAKNAKDGDDVCDEDFVNALLNVKPDEDFANALLQIR